MRGEMDATLTRRERDERTTRLLRHCLALVAPVPARVPARVRLDEAIGPDFARMLVTSLTARGSG
jgi:hypothetical protein